jgi:transketolase
MRNEITRLSPKIWSKLGQRGTFFGVAIPEIAKENSKVFVITADLMALSGLSTYSKLFNEQFLNVGIAEQNMIGVAAGLAKEGFLPYVTTYATFVTMRCFEQLRQNLGVMGFNIKVIGTSAGVTAGMSGVGHFSLEDVALMRTIPNLVVVSACDALEAYKIAIASIACPQPMYIRLHGGLNSPMVYEEDFNFCIGKANIIETGCDLMIIATGPQVFQAKEISRQLRSYNVSCYVIDMHTIKPIDKEIIRESVNTTKRLIISLEEHLLIGGLGSAISEVIAEEGLPVKLVKYGFSDSYPVAGEYNYILEKSGIGSSQIASYILEMIETKDDV